MGNVARVLAAIGVVGLASVSVAADLPVRSNPGAFLLPPVATPNTPPPATAGADLPGPTREPIRDNTDDRIVPFAPVRETPPREREREPERFPPPRAATLAPPRDIVPVSAQAIDESRAASEAERPKQKPTDLIDYLSGKGDFRPASKNLDLPPVRDRLTGTSDHSSGRFRDKVVDAVDGGGGHDWFKPDHCFDAFISPVTNPFLFEDPRSTTEIRPIFIYQRVPGREPVFQGGNVTFIGAQGRLAITDRWSVVMNKLGGIGVNPNNAFLSDETGFAEIWLGPKYTFLRDQDTGAVAAGGLTFQIPAGSGNVNQNTGTLSMVPYVSYAQNFWDTGWGSFNGIVNTGYAFSVNNERSDYYYLSTHLDFDVCNKHRFYPLIELNWFYNTTNGSTSPFTFEGRDLINFGSQGKGSNLLTGALGGRVKITNNIETGAAFEIPLAGNRDLFQYRWTVDLIWRF